MDKIDKITKQVYSLKCKICFEGWKTISGYLSNDSKPAINSRKNKL